MLDLGSKEKTFQVICNREISTVSYHNYDWMTDWHSDKFSHSYD